MPKTANHYLSYSLHRKTWLIIFPLFAGMTCSVYAQTTVNKLTAEDYSEILQLYFKYPLTLDSGGSLGFANLFT